MASPGKLVTAMAEVLGVPAVNVGQHDRNLLAAGKRSRGGRGRSAAKVTAADAANLLIPVAAGSLVRSTVETWQDYALLPLTRSIVDDTADPRSGPWHAFLPKEHTFEQALTALITSAQDGSLGRFRDEQWADAYDRRLNFFFLHIEFSGPVPLASISFHSLRSKREDQYWPTFLDADAALEPRAGAFNKKYGQGDLRTDRHIGARTIFALGDLLNT